MPLRVVGQSTEEKRSGAGNYVIIFKCLLTASSDPRSTRRHCRARLCPVHTPYKCTISLASTHLLDKIATRLQLTHQGSSLHCVTHNSCDCALQSSMATDQSDPRRCTLFENHVWHICHISAPRMQVRSTTSKRGGNPSAHGVR